MAERERLEELQPSEGGQGRGGWGGQSTDGEECDGLYTAEVAMIIFFPLVFIIVKYCTYLKDSNSARFPLALIPKGNYH